MPAVRWWWGVDYQFPNAVNIVNLEADDSGVAEVVKAHDVLPEFLGVEVGRWLDAQRVHGDGFVDETGPSQPQAIDV